MLEAMVSREELEWRLPLFLEKLEEAVKQKDPSARVAYRTAHKPPYVVYEVDIYTDDLDDCYVLQYNQMTGQLRAIPARR